MKFEWDMTEDDWKAMKNLQNDRDNDDVLDWFGNCHVGGICCDFQHTLDSRACLKNKSCTKHIFPRPFS